MQVFRSALCVILALSIEFSAHAVSFESAIVLDSASLNSIAQLLSQLRLRDNAEIVTQSLASTYDPITWMLYNRIELHLNRNPRRSTRVANAYEFQEASTVNSAERQCVARQLQELVTLLQTPGNANILRDRSIYDIHISTSDWGRDFESGFGTAEVQAHGGSVTGGTPLQTLVLYVRVASHSNGEQCALVTSHDIRGALNYGRSSYNPVQLTDDTRSSKQSAGNSTAPLDLEPTRFLPAR